MFRLDIRSWLGEIVVTYVLKRGSLSNASTWQRFYNRQVESFAEKY